MQWIEYTIVTIIVLGAAAYVLRYALRLWRGTATGCGCGNDTCPKSSPEQADTTRKAGNR